MGIKALTRQLILPAVAMLIIAIVLASCAPAASPAPAQKPATTVTPKPTPASPTPLPNPTAEIRRVEMEWPPHMRLGESDIIRLSLAPASDGYALKADFPEHQTISQTIRIPYTEGYDLYVAARLDGVGFQISPSGEQEQYLPESEAVHWRWSLTPNRSGQQRLSITLLARWKPTTNPSGIRERVLFSSSINVQVLSFLGLSQPQTMAIGLVGFLIGGGIGLLALRRRTAILPVLPGEVEPVKPHPNPEVPNPAIKIELPPGLILKPEERSLLETLFNRYDRLVLEREFLSGYSGARTFLVHPIRGDGRADAYMIAKLGERSAILREYESYETFVKDTLPPITARIQRPPVVHQPGKQAAIQYTFLGQAGTVPASLRTALLASPDPALLQQLFDTFGPNWWMQRRPYTFRLAVEYDRLLPAHLVLEPVEEKGRPLDGRWSPFDIQAERGQVYSLSHFEHAEPLLTRQGFSLTGTPPPGQPPLRVRWLGSYPSQALRSPVSGKVVATRQSLLQEYTAGIDLFGLPDPLPRLPTFLGAAITGTQSTIHGDLNLENVLVGPGGMVWLIDFAQTREGHPLYDFAHLEAEIIAHIIAAEVDDPGKYLLQFQSAWGGHPESKPYQLLTTLHTLAGRCLFNPAYFDEYSLPLLIACLGALKFPNLNNHARGLLFLTAAHLAQNLI